VIVGRLIPAGTGLAYHKIRRRQAAAESLEVPPLTEPLGTGTESQEQVA
jgi:DNA-directed RNA polymerase subunit beta'